MTWFWLYLASINGIAFVAMGADKRRAKRHMRRTPEATLLLLAVIGGSVGAILGMLCFRHKTRHPQFYLGLPAILAAQLALTYCVYRIVC
jgi:uncharacterized membrane protein YsdA (DUF1294 family)